MIQQREKASLLVQFENCPGFQRDQFWSPAPLLGYLFRLAVIPGYIVFIFFMCKLTELINSVGLPMHMLQNALCLVLFAAFGRWLRVIEPLRILCTVHWAVFVSSPRPFALSSHRCNSVFHVVI